MNAAPTTSDRTPGPAATPVDGGGATFSWRMAGRGNGTPVMLLHGLLGSRRSWEPQLASLSGDRTVLAWDAPGYGGSAALGAPSFEAFGDAVARCADEAGFDRFHLVGLSFGGMIAQYAALRHPQRLASLSLLSTSPKFGFDGVTMPESWRAARLAPLDAGQQPPDFAPAVLRAISGPSISDEALAGEVRAAELVSERALRVAIDVLVTHDTCDALERIAVPTLCVVGELDAETPVAYSRFIADRIPGAQLVVVPRAGHLVNVEAPGDVNRLLADRFAGCEAGRG